MAQIRYNRKNTLRSLLLAVLLLPALASAETSLWRISQGNNQLYLGGTVHLLSQSDYPLPDEFEQAFREIDTLVLEADLDAFTKPEAQARLRQRLTYPTGNSLKSAINPKTYKALRHYCKSAGLSIDSLNVMKPSLVVLTLTLAEMSRLGMAGAGVDQFFLNKAKSAGKKVTGLESPETQINALEMMGKGQEDTMILSTIKDLKQTPEFMVEMKDAWRSGNLAELEKTGIRTLQSTFPALNQSLLTSRNNDWIPKIKALLTTPEKELILVGALHLAGKEGVLAQLKKQGYAVEPY